ncbi:hypothetical protein [Rhodovulum viride]|uniref:hypothetical protein n=1 Tax=Rhodovulum viride TaxID=1231134 RepID=UPI0011BEBCE3|nr:hypothetical protein [Rhodovulum viride]
MYSPGQASLTISVEVRDDLLTGVECPDAALRDRVPAILSGFAQSPVELRPGSRFHSRCQSASIVGMGETPPPETRGIGTVACRFPLDT